MGICTSHLNVSIWMRAHRRPNKCDSSLESELKMLSNKLSHALWRQREPKIPKNGPGSSAIVVSVELILKSVDANGS
jgi:hypothetical protein